MAKDRHTIARLLRETIVQLCRSNSPFGGGRVEVDGIICISGQVEGQELVIKVHEVLHESASSDGSLSSLPSATGPPFGARYFPHDHFSGLAFGDRAMPASGAATVAGDVLGLDCKRRRLGLGFDPLGTAMPPPPPPPPSALYAYLSRFGYDPLRIGNGTGFTRTPEIDFHLTQGSGIIGGVKDLSMKSTVSPSMPSRFGRAEHSPSPPRRPTSPTDDQSGLSDSFDSRDERLRGQKRLAAMMSGSGYDRWSPSRPMLTIPQCLLCGYRFDSPEALGEHNESVHSIFTCLCCFKTFTSRSNLERHSRLHTGHRPYVCPVCQKTFSRKDHLSNHATKHAYKCGTCTRRCADRPALNEHYRLEHPDLPLAAVCAYCNKGFGSVEAYEDHVKVHPQYHAAAAAAGDQFIDDQPPSSSSLSAVLSQCHCHVCGFEAADSGALLHHQRIAHVATSMQDAYDSCTGIFKCSVCGQICSTLLGLRQHEALHIYELADARAAQQNNSAVDFSISSTATGDRIQPDDNGDKSPESAENQLETFGCRHCNQDFETYSDLCFHLRSLAAAAAAASAASSAPANEELAAASGHHRDKRKQKQPKPLIAVEISADDDDEGNDVNVVSPDDLKQNPAESVLTIDIRDAGSEPQNEVGCKSDPGMSEEGERADAGATEIKSEPIRSIMNRSTSRILTSSRASHRGRHRRNNLHGSAIARSLHFSHVSGSSEKSLTPRAAVNTEDLWQRERSDGVQSTPCLQSYLGDHSGVEFDIHSERPASAMLAQSSPDDPASNNNNGPMKHENIWMSSSGSPAPNGPQRCVVCGLECAGFADMEAHCIAEHSRSPCMFCAKTFAQKANRDRHVCLHTGDRPYGCPECGERFSRGDKLKMHRVRTHGILYPMYGSRGGRRANGGSTAAASEGMEDRESRNLSNSPASSMLDLSSSEFCSTGATVIGAAGGGENVDHPNASRSPAPNGHGSASVWNPAASIGAASDNGELMDLRIGSSTTAGSCCSDPATSSGLQFAWNGARFPKLEDDAATEGTT